MAFRTRHGYGLCGCETGASRTETSQRDHKGDTEASDSGRFARQFCVVHAQTVVSAQYCSGDDLYGRARSSRGVTWNGAFCAFYSGFEDILKQAFEQNFAWMTTSQVLAWTGSGLLQKPIQQKIIGSSILQRSPVRKICLYSMCST